MSRSAGARSRNSVLAMLTAAIIGVIALDATAIVAAPNRAAGPLPTRLPRDPMAVPGSGTALRVLNWSGHTWLVYPEDQAGPEQVPLSNSMNAVYVDNRGRLHLQITKEGGTWKSVELESLDPVSYGTFTMQVDTKTARFDPYTVLGMFVYRPGSKLYTNELDVEESQYPGLLKAPDNAQFAVQPYWAPDHLHPYPIPTDGGELRQQLTWLPGRPGHGIAAFETRLGRSATSPVLAKWTYQGYSVPTPFGMHLYINLWINEDKPPLSGTHSAVISSYSYVPASF